MTLKYVVIIDIMTCLADKQSITERPDTLKIIVVKGIKKLWWFNE